MNKKAKVYAFNKYAGVLEEHDDGRFTFIYDSQYKKNKEAKAISLTLPIRDQEYESTAIFPFFDGLIPEGWLLNLTIKTWKIDVRDRMALLLKTCSDCIGSVHIEPFDGGQNDFK